MDETTEAKEPRAYEISFLVRDEQGRDAVLSLVRRLGGELLFEGPFERIALAYPIKRETAAAFGFIHARLSPDALAELEGELKTIGSLLRYLIITPPFLKNKPRSVFRGRAPQTDATIPSPVPERRAPESLPLTNEALEKRIEEILKQ
jgi:ribosomal protein S6